MCLFHADITNLNKFNKTVKVCAYTCTYVNLAIKLTFFNLILEILDFPHPNFSMTFPHEQKLSNAFMAWSLCSNVIFLLDAIFLMKQ